MRQNKISEEDAQKQLDIFIDYYDIDINGEFSEDAVNLKQAASGLKKHIMRGRVTIEDGEDIIVTQHLERPSGDTAEIVYSVYGGIAKQQMQKANEKDKAGMIYHMMGSLAGLSGNAIAKFKGVDLSAAECLGILFLSV